MWRRLLIDGFGSAWLARTVLFALFAWALWVGGYTVYALSLDPVDDEPSVDEQARVLSPPRRIFDTRPLLEPVLESGRPGDMFMTYRKVPVRRIGDGRRWSVVFIGMGDQRLARHGGQGPSYATLARYMRAVRELVDRRHTQVVFVRMNPTLVWGRPWYWQGVYWRGGCGADGGCIDRYLLGGQRGYEAAHAWALALIRRAGYRAVDVRTLPIVVLLDPSDRVVAIWWDGFFDRKGFPLTSVHLARAVATLQRRAGLDVRVPEFPRPERLPGQLVDIVYKHVTGNG